MTTGQSSMAPSRRSWKKLISIAIGLRRKFVGRCQNDRWSPDMAKVLIVEDNPANMTLAVFLLESAGYSVITATNAEAGLTLARDEQPHLILMDIQLPGMDGLEATALLKQAEATRAIPVIALTALAMKGDEARI